MSERMYPSGVELAEELRRGEVEWRSLRGRHAELSGKFVQLERAFAINLEWQRRHEIELEVLRRETEELRKINEENARIKVDINAKLADAIEERNYWKKVFQKQRRALRRREADHGRAMMFMKHECEEILGNTRKTAEKHFRELLGLYENSNKKADRLENQLAGLQGEQKIQKSRAYELANLLETLERFHVNANVLCHLTATAVKDLIERGNSFEEDLKALRQLSWMNEKKAEVDSELDLLRTQNNVFREVIKSLKRRFQTSEVPERDGTEIVKNSTGDKREGCPGSLSNHSPTNKFTEDSGINGPKKHAMPAANANSTAVLKPAADENAITLKDVSNNAGCKLPDKSRDRGGGTKAFRDENVLRLESHLNGTSFEEYVIKFSDDHEMKIKHSPETSAQALPLRLAFAEDENEYQEGSANRVWILLNNIYTVMKYPASGVNCATQTLRRRFSTKFTQTSLTGIGQFSRLNAGTTMLNSEKRAIERSLRNLEQTVASLKCDAMGQARAMIDTDSKLLENDELLECIKVLTR